MASDTFCPIPWIFQGVRSNGDLRVCCQANISKSRGIISDEEGKVLNAASTLLDKARNAKILKELRSDILEGKWSPVCIRCEQEEKAGLVSRRNYENKNWEMDQNAVFEKTKEDGTINTQDFPVLYYDLRFGNLCNLKCRMCGPTDSSAWYKDFVELNGATQFNEVSGKVELKLINGQYQDGGVYDWHQEDHFWNELSKNYKNIKHIYMAGGEPLLIEQHYDFLEKCINEGAAENIILEYNTNLTLLPKRALDLWVKFKQVRVGASIDGFGQAIEYQRYPLKWDIVLSNLEKLNQQPENIFPWLACTVTAYNIFHIPDFIDWKIRNDHLQNINRSKRRCVITHHVAHHPKHLNIRVLPESLKLEVKEKYDRYAKKILQEDWDDHIKSEVSRILSSIVNYMNAGDYYSQSWGEFTRVTRKLDEMRGQKLEDVFPEFEGHVE